jgi:hypothetical protein
MSTIITFVFHKSGGFLDQLSNYQLINKNTATDLVLNWMVVVVNDELGKKYGRKRPLPILRYFLAFAPRN